MEIKIMSVTDNGCETVATVRDYAEITDYRLTLLAPWLPSAPIPGLNCDEVVETAHEYGFDIPYDSLPTVPGEVVEGEGWQVALPN